MENGNKSVYIKKQKIKNQFNLKKGIFKLRSENEREKEKEEKN